MIAKRDDGKRWNCNEAEKWPKIIISSPDGTCRDNAADFNDKLTLGVATFA